MAIAHGPVTLEMKNPATGQYEKVAELTNVQCYYCGSCGANWAWSYSSARQAAALAEAENNSPPVRYFRHQAFQAMTKKGRAF